MKEQISMLEACFTGDVDGINDALADGVDPNEFVVFFDVKECLRKATPLMVSAARGWPDAVRLLCDVSDIDLKNHKGMNALDFAAMFEQSECTAVIEDFMLSIQIKEIVETEQSPKPRRIRI